MEFEWDDNKNRKNILKHGISFEEAKELFFKPRIIYEDKRIDYGEKRLISLGLIDNSLIISVVYTKRRGKTRLISARPANKKERELYYEQIQLRNVS